MSVEGWEAIPCSVSSTPVTNDFRPEPYEPGTEEYERTMSKLHGTYTGPDLTIDYSEYRESPSPAPETAQESSPAEGGGENEGCTALPGRQRLE